MLQNPTHDRYMHAALYILLFCSLLSHSSQQGQKVNQGEVIGRIFNTKPQENIYVQIGKTVKDNIIEKKRIKNVGDSPALQ